MNSNNSSKEIAAIVIAAGESRRYEAGIKQLVSWHGKPLIAYILSIIIKSGLSPIFVITGAHSHQIRNSIKEFPVKIIQNSEWKKGKGTSISLGIKALPSECLAAMIFVTDQPFLSLDVINKIRLEYSKENKKSIIAPFYQGIQANPVLFTKKVFPHLANLKKEQGGKDLMRYFSVSKIRWLDKRILLDIDTVKNYEDALLLSNLPD